MAGNQSRCFHGVAVRESAAVNTNPPSKRRRLHKFLDCGSNSDLKIDPDAEKLTCCVNKSPMGHLHIVIRIPC